MQSQGLYITLKTLKNLYLWIILNFDRTSSLNNKSKVLVALGNHDIGRRYVNETTKKMLIAHYNIPAEWYYSQTLDNSRILVIVMNTGLTMISGKVKINANIPSVNASLLVTSSTASSKLKIKMEIRRKNIEIKGMIIMAIV